MAWLGIWFEHGAGEGGARSPERFRGLARPIVYPFARAFIEGESRRLRESRDPGRAVRDGEAFQVYYSLDHDAGEGGLDRQGCRIARFLLEHFDPGSPASLCGRFSEVPVVIHAVDPARAAALGNALALLRFLGAAEDQAVARILLHPWKPLPGGPERAAHEYEDRVIDFLHGQVFYPEEVDLFDVLERNDLRNHRTLDACCREQLPFLGPLLEWVDDSWPETAEERARLRDELRRSLADEARSLRAAPSRRIRG